MITETGKNILAKYLIGQAPAYASYVALGCGPKPIASNQELGDYSSKTSLDFEMFRTAITSRGYVYEDGINKIVLTAELPTDERYEISEVGIYSAGANPSAGAYDSKTLYAFTVNENWEYHLGTSSTALPIIYEPLDGEDKDNIIDQTHIAFQTNSENRVFTDQNRAGRYERARFYNNVVLTRGDMSTINVVNGHLEATSNSKHIHLTGTSLSSFTKNAPTDELKMAFTVINKDPDPSFQPKEIRILLEFAPSDTEASRQSGSAAFEIVLKNTDYDFVNNRYFVVTKQLQELDKQTGFTWNNITTAKIYTTILDINDSPSDDFYIGFDAIRFENVATTNPIYGLTGYTIVKTPDAETIVKAANTTNYIEFRFALDVQ
jgi:hypothetical protein